MDAVWNELVSALTNGQPAQLPLALVGHGRDRAR